jgi:hypothetical protein
MVPVVVGGNCLHVVFEDGNRPVNQHPGSRTRSLSGIDVLGSPSLDLQLSDLHTEVDKSTVTGRTRCR